MTAFTHHLLISTGDAVESILKGKAQEKRMVHSLLHLSSKTGKASSQRLYTDTIRTFYGHNALTEDDIEMRKESTFERGKGVKTVSLHLHDDISRILGLPTPADLPCPVTLAM